MAKRIGKGSSKKGAAAKSVRKKAEASANGVGHNSQVIPKKAVKEFFAKLDRVHDAKESDNAKHMADIKSIYDDAKNDTGIKGKIFRLLYQEHRHQLKIAKALKAMDQNEKHDADRLMAAGESFGKTSPFGIWCRAQAGVDDQDGGKDAADAFDDPAPEPAVTA